MIKVDDFPQDFGRAELVLDAKAHASREGRHSAMSHEARLHRRRRTHAVPQVEEPPRVRSPPPTSRPRPGARCSMRQPFAPDELDEVILGCAAPSVDEVNIGRVAALRMGCGQKVPAGP